MRKHLSEEFHVGGLPVKKVETRTEPEPSGSLDLQIANAESAKTRGIELRAECSGAGIVRQSRL
jgi:hypothetical protein